MKILVQCAAVGAAGCVGALSRWMAGLLCARLFRTELPIGTLLINVSGSFLLGWFLTALGDQFNASETMRLAVATGFLGAYTTFSTFMFEADALWSGGYGVKAIAYLMASIVLGLLAVRAGIWLAAR